MIFHLIRIYLNSKLHFLIWTYPFYPSNPIAPFIFPLNQNYLNSKYQISYNPFLIQTLPLNFFQSVFFSLTKNAHYPSTTFALYFGQYFQSWWWSLPIVNQPKKTELGVEMRWDGRVVQFWNGWCGIYL